MSLVLAEYVPELLNEHGLFLPAFQTVPDHNQADAQNTSPFINYDCRSDGRKNDAGVDGVPQARVRTGTDKLMVFLDGDPGAPIFRQVITSPDCQPNT